MHISRKFPWVVTVQFYLRFGHSILPTLRLLFRRWPSVAHTLSKMLDDADGRVDSMPDGF